jgi:murein DD-endopeptidase MepM/ murein hydrolase activator NlpD
VFSGHSSSANPLTSKCVRFNALNTRIRDNRIDSRSARIELKRLLAEVRDEYFRAGGIGSPKSAWVFPLAGYDARAIGGGRRHGYVSGNYDYYRGNRHGGHPSFDIFIRDRNQDSLDDRSGTPVKVLSLTGGIVVALEREWQPDSRLLGGRYLWIYDPANELLVYYAHNGELSVGLGAIVRPGDVLASVGRSGFNAAKRRSPTHLHLTVLRVQDGRVAPLDVYQDLKRARVFDKRS